MQFFYIVFHQGSPCNPGTVPATVNASDMSQEPEQNGVSVDLRDKGHDT